MDWIERWFDVAPDNGDGTVEALVLVVLFVLAFCLFAATFAPLRVWLFATGRKTVAAVSRLTRRGV